LVFVSIPVPSFVTVTAASGMAALDESRTLPTMLRLRTTR